LIFTLFPALPQDRRKLCVAAEYPTSGNFDDFSDAQNSLGHVIVRLHDWLGDKSSIIIADAQLTWNAGRKFD